MLEGCGICILCYSSIFMLWDGTGNLNICIVRQYIDLLFYIILWSEQKCGTGNIINGNVYCLISVCSWFEVLYFLVLARTGVKGEVQLWYGGSTEHRAALPISFYKVREITARSVPRQLRKEVVAVGGPERAIFTRNFQAIKVVICGIYVF
jgi:hypothetical protein